MSQTAAFQQKLEPLSSYLQNPLVTEIAINQPGELWFLYQGERYMQAVKKTALTYSWLKSLSQLVAFSAQQTIDVHSPLLSATIPYLDKTYRVQIIWPPAVERNTIAVCIRRSSSLSLSLRDYANQHAFDALNMPSRGHVESKNSLSQLFCQHSWDAFLRHAVQSGQNIVISAGTNAGKTTLLNALLKEIDPRERIVTIEDAREILSTHANSLHLLYARNKAQMTTVNPVTLLESVLRLNPDRILMGELRGAEAYAYLELLNSGHTGAITTIHADSPTLMFERLAQMVMRFNPHYTHDEIVSYAKSLIQVVIQCELNNNGQRQITEIWCNDRLLQCQC